MEATPNPDRDLASQLRDSAGREWAEEAAEDESQTEALRQRQMDLLTVVEDAAHRGDRATVEMGDSTLSGPIINTGTDYLTIVLAEQEADVMFDAGIWTFVSGDNPSTGPKQSGMSFLGLLKQHAGTGMRVRVELIGGSVVLGVIKLVSSDHLRIEDPDGRLTYVPTINVRAVIRSSLH
jgi:hypothetical protein